MESLHREEISEWARVAYCKGQFLNRWHVITLSHSKRACPITRVKSSVQELRLPRHFAWSASRWDSRTKMQQGGSAFPWRSDFIGSQSQRYHHLHLSSKPPYAKPFNETLQVRDSITARRTKRTIKRLVCVSTSKFSPFQGGHSTFCPLGLFNGSSRPSQQPPKRTGGAN